MLKKISLTISSLVILLSTANAQHFTNSPYSYFGLGEINHITTGQAVAMGGGMASSRFGGNLNFNNSASYSSLNNQSYIFNVGVSAKQSLFSYLENTVTQNNSNLEYITAGFRASKYWASSFGLMPYSSIGYKINKNYTENNNLYEQAYVGTGGLNKVYFGNSFKLHKTFSLGIGTSYLFGSLNKNISSRTTSEEGFGDYTSFIEVQQDLKMTGFRFDFGVQSQFKVKEVLVGLNASYEANSELSSYGTEYVISNQINGNISNIDSLYAVDDADLPRLASDVPDKISAGILLNFSNKLTINTDYTVQDWSQAALMGETPEYYTKSERISAGLEYVHNIASFKYKEAIRYRLGAYRQTGYQLVPQSNGSLEQPTTYGVTCGVGFPLRSSPTFLNIALELGNTATTDAGISESFIILHADFALRDIWFIQRKYN